MAAALCHGSRLDAETMANWCEENPMSDLFLSGRLEPVVPAIGRASARPITPSSEDGFR